jgi:hypothetical protein
MFQTLEKFSRKRAQKTQNFQTSELMTPTNERPSICLTFLRKTHPPTAVSLQNLRPSIFCDFLCFSWLTNNTCAARLPSAAPPAFVETTARQAVVKKPRSFSGFAIPFVIAVTLRQPLSASGLRSLTKWL